MERGRAAPGPQTTHRRHTIKKGTTAAPIVTDFATEAAAYQRSGLTSAVSVEDTTAFLTANYDALVEALSAVDFRGDRISAFVGDTYVTARVKEDGLVLDLYLSVDTEDNDGSFVTWYHRNQTKPALVQFIERLYADRS